MTNIARFISTQTAINLNNSNLKNNLMLIVKFYLKTIKKSNLN